MRNKSKSKIIIFVLGILFSFSTISNYNLIGDHNKNEETIEHRDETNFTRLKESGGYNEPFIHIDGSIPGNWSATEGEQWCSGDGSWGNPYVIENVTIDASSSPTGNGIFINNSKTDYFIIRNCTVYNAGSGSADAGIKLENTNNGTLRNNNCSNNVYRGILLITNCKNNTILENTANNNQVDGIMLWECDNNTISNNTAQSNGYTGIIIVSSSYNTITRNIANNNGDYGIMLYGFTTYCLNNTVSGNTASNIITSNQDSGIYLLGSSNNIISNNTVNNNNQYGINLYYCDGNNISGNTIYYNKQYGVYLTYNCNENDITQNYIYFNTNGVIFIDTPDCDDNRITRNILVSSDEKFINDDGTNTVISMNSELLSPPYLYVEIVGQLFSITEYFIIINVSSELHLDFSIQSVQMWWDGIVVPSNNITEIGKGLYNISLTPIFVALGESPILLNITVSAIHHLEKYFEIFITVEPPEIVKFLQVEIIDHSYSLEHFNFTFLVCNEVGHGIDSATIQMWWNDVDVSDNVINLGNGFYFVSLDPITVAPGKDPILLNMTISALGYEDKLFETYLAVDPLALRKDDFTAVGGFPIYAIIIGVGVVALSIYVLWNWSKKKRISKAL